MSRLSPLRVSLPGCPRLVVVGAACVAMAAVFGCAEAGVAAANPFNIKIVNESGRSPDDIYVMLHDNAGTAASLDGQLTDNVGKPLSSITNSTVQMGDISAARLFFSYGAPVTYNEPNDNSTLTRYDKIEFTNPGVANLTAVDFFGIPFSLQSLDSGENPVGGALSYRCYTDTIATALKAVGPAAQLTNGGQFVRNWSPNLFPDSFASMAPYLRSMAGQTITIDDRFDTNGPPVVHDAINYTGAFQADGSITLNGTLTPDGGSAVAGLTVQIDGANLDGVAEPGIYSGNGDYTKGGDPGHVGDNDQYAVIYRDIVAGFSLGYWGGKYGNAVSDWRGQPDFAAAQTTTQPYATYNQYAAVIADYSSAYAYSFHDVGPTPVAVPLDSSVATLELVIAPDSGPNIPGCVGDATPPSSSSPTDSPSSSPASGQVKVSIDTSVARLDGRGRALVKLTCSGDPCSGELNLTAAKKVKSGKRHRGARRALEAKRRHKAKRKKKKKSQLLVGRADFRLSEGQTRGVRVQISKRARNLMKHARGHRLRTLAKAIVGPLNSPTVADQRRVVLRPYTKRRKHRGHKRVR